MARETAAAQIEYEQAHGDRVASLGRLSNRRLARYTARYWWKDGSGEIIVATVSGVVALVFALFGFLPEVMESGLAADVLLVVVALVVFGLVRGITKYRLEFALYSSGLLGDPTLSRSRFAKAGILVVAAMVAGYVLFDIRSNLMVAFIVLPVAVALAAAGAWRDSERFFVLSAALVVVAVAAGSFVSFGVEPQAVAVALSLGALAVMAGVSARLALLDMRRAVDENPAGVIEAALAQIRDERPAWREVAIVSIVGLLREESIEPAVRGLADVDEAVREVSAQGLLLLRDNVPDALVERRFDIEGFERGDMIPWTEVDLAVEHAGREWIDLHTVTYRRLLEQDDDLVNGLIASADPDGSHLVLHIAGLVLSDARSDRGIEHLLGLLEDSRAWVREVVEEILGPAGPAALHRLLGLLDDPRAHVRASAVRSISAQVVNTRSVLESKAELESRLGAVVSQFDDEESTEMTELAHIVPQAFAMLADDPAPEVRAAARAGTALFVTMPTP